MTISNIQINNLRKDRGWSQEKLAAISGLSERTIQRVEKDGTCSLDTKMALATAFELSPTELLGGDEKEQQAAEFKTDWGGAFGLAILGMAIPLIILLTGTNATWEVISFSIVIGGVTLLSIMTYGAGNTYKLFDKTSWIVRYPLQVSGLNNLIVHAKSLINNAYIVAVIASLVAGLTLAVHKPEMLDTYKVFIPIILKPILYAILFVEFWFRPYKRKMERMLSNQRDDQ
ncbi:helix-turn-helix domain-containing protein [Colwelliaceae bacterium BS250]